METKVEDTSTTTREFTLEFLKQITDNFSKKHIIGYGGYGVVYKGVLENGEEIALKKLHHIPGLDDTQFRNEFNNLMRAQHPNITRLVGYCYNLGQRLKYNGEYIFAAVEERVLCFEYLQGGSLDKYISDESGGLDWQTRFKIIKGVCEGLNYLHNGCKDPIYHLDLKPSNILMDKNMFPKIGDFGMSRLFPSGQTDITGKIIGTFGYMPPEYIERYEITSKYDVFSLGVTVVRIVAGNGGYFECAHMSSQEFIDHVHENWGKRMQATMSSRTSEQVKACIEIALRCLEVDREKRPTIAEIVDGLNKVDTAESSLTGQLILAPAEDTRTMENKLKDTSATARKFTLEFLEQITDDFSEEHIIGHGGYGVVYKGILENGEEIALEKFDHTVGFEDVRFRNEINNLLRVRHPNIIRLVGYCYDLGHQSIENNGEYVLALKDEKILCLEYLKGGSLDKHISDEFCRLDWHTRFKIIKGVCEGLDYLHNGSKYPIYHLDLKPTNILLDKNMNPKIGGFGLSKLFPLTQTYITIKIEGTPGYMPPEYTKRYEITSKYDVFSFGVIIIRIIAGHNGYSQCAHMSSQEFLEQVYKNWGKWLHKSMSLRTSEQVKTCIVIALRCVDVDHEKRPTITEIFDELKKVDIAKSSPIGQNTEEDHKTLKKQPTKIQEQIEHLEQENNEGLQHTSVTPREYSPQLLKHITNNFSKNRIIGRGGFGVVYKGVLHNGEVIAVKKLYNNLGELGDGQFKNEIIRLMSIQHQNIVRLVGYCYDTRHIFAEFDRKPVFADVEERAICLEYYERGSLEGHLSDESRGLEWHARYKIIKGICEGLKYLHTGSENPVYHLDLKPTNILLDSNMIPKICDFGISRLVGSTNTCITETVTGTRGYMPPEYVDMKIISRKSDVYSLGVIMIHVIAGEEGYRNFGDMLPQEFAERVREKWGKQLQATISSRALKQVKTCIEIALRCVEFDRKKRPTISEVLDELNKIDTAESSAIHQNMEEEEHVTLSETT